MLPVQGDPPEEVAADRKHERRRRGAMKGILFSGCRMCMWVSQEWVRKASEVRIVRVHGVQKGEIGKCSLHTYLPEVKMKGLVGQPTSPSNPAL